MQLAVRFRRADRRALLQQHVAGIHPGIHRDDRDPRLRTPIANRGLQRRRPAIKRQQTRVHVERDRYGIKQNLRHDLPVRRHDERFAAERAHVVDERLELLRREHAQPARLRRALERRRAELLPAPRGPIGLRDDADDIMPFGERCEDRDGELARPEDDELQRVPAATASASATSSSDSAGRTFLALSM